MSAVDSELEQYILKHIDPEPPELTRVYRHTYMHHLYPRMCSGHYQGRLLKMLTAMVNPSRVLEIGTFTGYATLSIAEALRPGAVIDTIEIDVEKEDELRERFDRPGHNINLIIGDALDVLPTLSDAAYDMVFIDANKRFYGRYLEMVYPKLKPGAFVLVDNTLWDMKILNGSHDNDPQTAAIARFNDEIVRDTRFEKIILPVRDGLTILRRVR